LALLSTVRQHVIVCGDPRPAPRWSLELATAQPFRSQLEPPGPLALHYGVQTPVSIVLAHVIYGAVLGAFYRLS